MIYISVQPAEPFFLWQLEIQLQNFCEIGLLPENVHVLIVYNEEDGIPNLYQDLENKRQANFFYYPDRRLKAEYISSIRPHVLKQHFTRYSYLSNETIFYHDSDIIFRTRLDEELFEGNDAWYLSDTSAYLSTAQLKSFGSDFFEGMCNLVGLDPTVLADSEDTVGGAQYVMKNLTASYWELVEENSEAIYQYIVAYKSVQIEPSAVEKLQEWCADMWAVLWIAWKTGFTTKVIKELDFCWPKDHISRWNDVKILHYTDVFYNERDYFFCKNLYRKYAPYYVDFSHLIPNTCSSVITQKIDAFRVNITKECLLDCTIILHINVFTYSQIKVETYLRYLNRYLNVTIVVVENSDMKRVNEERISPFCDEYFFLGEDNFSKIIDKLETANFLYIDSDIFVPIPQVVDGYNKLIANNRSLVRPYHSVEVLDMQLFSKFEKTLATEYLKANYQSTSMLLRGECFFMNKEVYLSIGGENLDWKHYVRSGFNLERDSRVLLLGLDIILLENTAFHLPQYHTSVNQASVYGAAKYLNRARWATEESLRCEIDLLHYSSISVKGYKEAPAVSWPLRIHSFCHEDEVSIADCDQLIQPRKQQFLLVPIVISRDADYALQCWTELVEAVMNHDFQSQPYFIFAEGGVSWTDAYTDEGMLRLLTNMYTSGLEFVSMGTANRFTNSKRLTEDLIWLETSLSAFFCVFSESFCQKIISYNFSKNDDLATVLNSLTELKAVAFPFMANVNTHVFSNITRVNLNSSRFIKSFFGVVELSIHVDLNKK